MSCHVDHFVFNLCSTYCKSIVLVFQPQTGTYENHIHSLILQIADVWPCGVMLYVMFVGAYLFEDPSAPRNVCKTIEVRFLEEMQVFSCEHELVFVYTLNLLIFIAN